MPVVGGEHFAYTPKGRKAAEAKAKRTGKKKMTAKKKKGGKMAMEIK